MSFRLIIFFPLVFSAPALAKGWEKAGTYTVRFDARDLHSGMYYYVLHTPTAVVRKTMVVVR